MRIPFDPHIAAHVGGGADVAVAHEVAQEIALSLGRAGRRLEDALRALAEFDAEPGDPRARAELVAEAGEALLFFLVQREACGARDAAAVIRELGVPREVQLRMSVRPADRGGRR